MGYVPLDPPRKDRNMKRQWLPKWLRSWLFVEEPPKAASIEPDKPWPRHVSVRTPNPTSPSPYLAPRSEMPPPAKVDTFEQRHQHALAPLFASIPSYRLLSNRQLQ